MADKLIRVRALGVNGRLLVHPSGAKFNASGEAAWPADAFTFRRIKDRDVEELGEVLGTPHPAPAPQSQRPANHSAPRRRQ